MSDPLMHQAVAALARGHRLFTGEVSRDRIGDIAAQARAGAYTTQGLPDGVAVRSERAAGELFRTGDTDRSLARVMAAARAERAHASAATRTILEAARADIRAADTPMGRREAIARMVARLRAQHRHIVRTHARARLLARRLRRLHYLNKRRPGHEMDTGSGRDAVLAAIRKALDIKGIHDPAARDRWERGMDLVARRESNYDACAVNNWDSNAAKGTPSKGVWQFIAPTFAAYHQPGTSNNIHDPVAQACAFINYARGRYGVAADASDLAVRIQQADPRRSPKGY